MTRYTSARILLTLLALGAITQRSSGQAPGSLRPVPLSLPCRVPLPRQPAEVVTLDLAMLERCSGQQLPEHLRTLADTANEAGVIHRAAVVAANQLYRKYNNREGDLGDLLAALAYVRMAEQTLVPESHQQAQFLGHVIAFHLAMLLAQRADSTDSCATWSAARLFAEESLRYPIFENPAHGPGIRTAARSIDSLATKRTEGMCVK